MLLLYVICCTVDQTLQRIKISSNFIQWFDYYHWSINKKNPGMEPMEPTQHIMLALVLLFMRIFFYYELTAHCMVWLSNFNIILHKTVYFNNNQQLHRFIKLNNYVSGQGKITHMLFTNYNCKSQNCLKFYIMLRKGHRMIPPPWAYNTYNYFSL